MGRIMLNGRQPSRVVRRPTTLLLCASLIALWVYAFVISPKTKKSSPSSSSSSYSSSLPFGYSYGSVREGSGEEKTTNTGGRGGYGGTSGGGSDSELFNNRFLNAHQCAAAFPWLTREIDLAVARGPFTLKKSGPLGPLVARIRDGKLTILQSALRNDLSRDMLEHRTATLHQIHAALLTAQGIPRQGDEDEDEVPRDTVFAFSHHDNPSPGTFSYCRPAAGPAVHQEAQGGEGDGPLPYFPIPHFAHWSWPLPFVGSLSDAGATITALEEGLGIQDAGQVGGEQTKKKEEHDEWDGEDKEDKSLLPSRWWMSKDPRAVWRGTPHFNSPSTTPSGRLRQELLRTVAEAGERHRSHRQHGQQEDEAEKEEVMPVSEQGTNPPWADVAALVWTQAGRNASNAVPIADFCRRRYIIYTEGITYSGRLAYHQLCGSVVLTPPLAWLQPTTHLVRPVFSHTLPGVTRNAVSSAENRKLTAYPAPWVEEAWGAGTTVDEANMVFVAPDWSDLEATVLWLEAHPRVAEGIARRQRELFHGRGYLSPAAEMCYWRAALRGWAKTVRYEDQGFEEMEGIPFEEFILSESHR